MFLCLNAFVFLHVIMEVLQSCKQLHSCVSNSFYQVMLCRAQYCSLYWAKLELIKFWTPNSPGKWSPKEQNFRPMIQPGWHCSSMITCQAQGKVS